MTLTIIIFLYAYLLFVLVWLVFSLIALYHIIKYGQISFTSSIATFSYLAVSALILYVSYQYLSQIDWSVALITVGNIGFFGSSNF
ncbi:MAG: hypothetical protein PHS62_04955 [Patescibacteria group bacterium]|nr:hypothetical protein [Patescibacteria group bacterium]